ncbi:MAG TPA: hypothetical protein VGD65_01495 [Chryseosolibacter sp.]
MMKIIYKKRRVIAFFFLICILLQVLPVPLALALTSGPSQPEAQSFQPAGASDMVDLFTGDFSYNIPLFELPGPNGGYPFNISYQSGVSMDQEASWVGLGWSLNPGAINRQMRGLPDEFKGDAVYTKTAIDPSVTIGLGAGVGIELFGADKGPSLKVGLSVNQNNYRGFGYSIDGSLGFEKAAQSGNTGGIALSLSLDSRAGLNADASLNLSGKAGGLGLRSGYNQQSGLQNISVTYESNKNIKLKYKDAKGKNHSLSASKTFGAAISLASPTYTPQVSMPMNNINISARFEPGGSWWGLFPNAYVTGFYNEQWLKDNKKRVRSNAFGYLNYQKSTSAKDLLDFNREKDGIISKETPNLGIPSLTYDIYSVTGQGIGTMYRPIRNDVGIIHDPETESTSNAGDVGVDAGPAASHLGVNVSFNHSRSLSGRWTENNEQTSASAFRQKTLDNTFEPWYFKAHGEQSAESKKFISSVGGDKAVRVKLDGANASPRATTQFDSRTFSAAAQGVITDERKSRSQMIQPFTREQLMSASGEMLSVFKIQYIDKNGAITSYDRSQLPAHHITAFTALTNEGLRYNYGIPAINTKQEDVSFTAVKPAGNLSRVNVGNNGGEDPNYNYSGTEKFLKKTELPAYAHSYLLTSIIGPDYVDVTGNGVSEDDLGYWVKFIYKKVTANTDMYKWRDPYSQAHVQDGWKTDPRDDKGSYSYGEKEIWYLAQAETKSHIAKFSMGQREDGYGVARKLQDNNEKGKALNSLTGIKLFTRAGGEASPVKSVKFEYDYSLCPGVYNNINGGGKLTLKKLWFEYGNSERGKLNPYQFTYHQNNPAYDVHAYDRWGTYKPYPSGNAMHNLDFPYAEQDPNKKSQIDDNAAAWSLTKIKLPSGGEILVDYETDDYAYVQHQTATQMMAIVDPLSITSSLKQKFNISDASLKVRFRLEKPFAPNQPQDILSYLDQKRKQLYFKLKINLRSSSENFFEYVSGYADIDFTKPMGFETGVTGNYEYGFFHLKAEDGNHPFSMRVWQHLRSNQPELANSGRKLEQTTDTGKRINQIKSLAGIGAQIRKLFEGFNNYCKNQGWGRQVEAETSWIRLNSPDKIKFGGGLRVRQITMKDDWKKDEEGVYGQVYEYTTEENGKIISSGVAAYEPLVGGDENPLRHAKKYVQSVPLRSDNNMFFEYPVNESYYPGPQVGYAKVTVTSLAAASRAGKNVKNITLSDGSKLFPQGTGVSFGTSGMTVHEFYTAREFPVITDETEKINKPYKLNVTVPFLGNISTSKMTTTQGYSIVTNDMHGKPKKVSNYRQDRDGKIESEPISWVKYNYGSESKIYEQEKVFSVTNEFKDNGDGTLSRLSAADLSNPSLEKFSLGQENEFFLDMRQHEDKTWGGGARVNTDIVYIPLVFAVVPVPIPTVWPNIGKSTSQLRSAVANKVIYKSGVLVSTEAFDGSSTIKTENLKWDKITGQPVLTTVNDNFNAPVYSYSIPAYTQYQGMGAAFQNAGLTFSIEGVQAAQYTQNQYNFSVKAGNQSLFPGDEILLYPATGELANPIARVIYNGEENGRKVLYCATALSATAYQAMIVRSGYRNQLNVQAGSVTALEDPSVTLSTKTYSKHLSIPK